MTYADDKSERPIGIKTNVRRIWHEGFWKGDIEPHSLYTADLYDNLREISEEFIGSGRTIRA